MTQLVSVNLECVFVLPCYMETGSSLPNGIRVRRIYTRTPASDSNVRRDLNECRDSYCYREMSELSTNQGTSPT